MQQVECRNIHHSYDGVRDAVHDLSLSIHAGEVMALIGPNGAGKSTTLRIFATLQSPDRGEVLWDGGDAWKDRYTIRQRVGFLGDGTALYPNMTAAGYLRFFAECYGQSYEDANKRVEELLETFDLTSKADAKISDMSKGMRQRLAIARTLVQQPELLLLDEPADGLDPLARRSLREILRKIADTGVGIVVSSHILRELDGFCDTVALIQKGRLEVFGTVDEVIEKYEVGRRVHEVHVTKGPADRDRGAQEARGADRGGHGPEQGRDDRSQDRRPRTHPRADPRKRGSGRAPTQGARALGRRGDLPVARPKRSRRRVLVDGSRRGQLSTRGLC